MTAQSKPVATTATVRFYAELNDFLPPERRFRESEITFFICPTVKDAVESLGVPHVEIDLILVNGTSVGFDHRVHSGDRISVYPVFESLNIAPLTHLRPQPLRTTAFVTDVHLRKLTRLLRLLGFDTAWDAQADDASLARISRDQRRILLTRDRQLLKRSLVTHGTWIRATDALEQAREVLRRFDLRNQVAAFTRCPACNGLLADVAKEDVLERIPPRTAAWLDAYTQCNECKKLYWRGTHTAHLEQTVRRILAPFSACAHRPAPSTQRFEPPHDAVGSRHD